MYGKDSGDLCCEFPLYRNRRRSGYMTPSMAVLIEFGLTLAQGQWNGAR